MPKVLVIDDASSNAPRPGLRHQGYDVRSAENGWEGRALLTGTPRCRCA